MQTTTISMALSPIARKKLAVADHVLTQTYPLVLDPKLLLSVCQSLDDVGQEALASGAKLTEEHAQTIQTIHAVVQQHKSASVEFRRKKNFVICQDDFRYSVISKDMVERHLAVLRTL